MRDSKNFGCWPGCWFNCRSGVLRVRWRFSSQWTLDAFRGDWIEEFIVIECLYKNNCTVKTQRWTNERRWDFSVFGRWQSMNTGIMDLSYSQDRHLIGSKIQLRVPNRIKKWLGHQHFETYCTCLCEEKIDTRLTKNQDRVTEIHACLCKTDWGGEITNTFDLFL